MKHFIWILGFFLFLTSCGSDDDICQNSDSTPRLKLKFKNDKDQSLLIETLFVDVDYGKEELTNILNSKNVESVLVPLRIDENPYTDIYIRTSETQTPSKVRVTYDKKAIYVSPACGFKINYENMKAELIQSDPVKSIEPNNTSLSDENSINFYLHF